MARSLPIRKSARAVFCCLAASIWLALQSGMQARQLRAEDTTSEEERVVPVSVPTYMGRQIAQTMHYRGARWLVRESREREEECSILLKSLGVRSGDTVCDLGCGNGFYALKLAKLVGESGSVLAVDIQPQMLGFLRTRAEEAAIDNIKPIRGTLTDPRLPESKVDLVLLVDVYHEFSHPEQMLRAIRKSLKPDGRIALVEFRLEDPDVPISLLHKMSKDQIMKELPSNGFKLIAEFNKLPWQHVMFFGRSDAPQKEINPTTWRKEVDSVAIPDWQE